MQSSDILKQLLFRLNFKGLFGLLFSGVDVSGSLKVKWCH
jgi:hypothetical protein